jgi:L-aminopeptidase/D-esterase-like protein
MSLFSRKKPEIHNGLTDIDGLLVGHWSDMEAATGCTVILCPDGAVAGVDVRGTAPGTREIALLDPVCMIEKVHAIVLAGGSAYGLAAADGAMRWLEEQGIGFDTGVAKVPIVPAAILFDLGLGRADVRPDAASGYAACQAASAGRVPQGNVGAGTGASVGKMLGFSQATKGGLGTASKQLAGGITVSALAAVNAIGDVLQPATGQIIAGARKIVGKGFADSQKFLESRLGQMASYLAGTNTTLAVVATNVALNKVSAQKIAQMAHDGLARTIRPVHTHFDGDTVFALSLGEKKADVSLIGAVAADVLAEAVVAAVLKADSLHGLPCARELAAPPFRRGPGTE